MATASIGEDPHPSTKNKGILKNHDQEDLLHEPYVQAVLAMDYKLEDIRQAVKVLHKRQKQPTAETLLQVIMDMESQGRPKNPPRCEKLKRPVKSDKYGSDGESEDGSLDDPSSLTHTDGDLQEDGESLRMARAGKVAGLKVTEPPAKKINRGKDGKEMAALQLHLKALREENRRLKSRQLCKKCGSKPVSITFLPCGHFSFCFECGQNFDSCPICRKTILADVKTFLA